MAKKTAKKTSARKPVAKKRTVRKPAVRKPAARKTVQTAPVSEPIEPAEPTDTDTDTDIDTDTDTDTAAEPSEPAEPTEPSTEPASNKKKSDEYKRVQTHATIPGVGKVKTTVIEVTLDGETHRATTRHACWIWLKAKRAEKRELVKAQKESDLAEKTAARFEKMAPRMTATLAHVSKKLEGLAAAPVINDYHREQLKNAIGLINAVVVDRKRIDNIDEDGKGNDA